MAEPMAAKAIGSEKDSRSEIAGVLLAGGLSRRMGGDDKSMALLAGEPLIAHAIARLRPQVGPLIINANGPPERFARFALPVVPDPLSGHVGPLAGVLAGMRWAKAHDAHIRWVASAACDTPFFPLTLVAALRRAAGAGERTIALASSGGRVHPVFGLWPVALADDLETALRSGVRKVLDWTGQHETEIAEFAPIRLDGSADAGLAQEIDPFFNANRLEDLAEAERYFAALSGRERGDAPAGGAVAQAGTASP